MLNVTYYISFDVKTRISGKPLTWCLILIESMGAGKVPFQLKSRLFVPKSRKVGFSIREVCFSAEKVTFQRPYFLLGFGLSTLNEAYGSTQSGGNTQLAPTAPNTWRIYSNIFFLFQVYVIALDSL